MKLDHKSEIFQNLNGAKGMLKQNLLNIVFTANPLYCSVLRFTHMYHYFLQKSLSLWQMKPTYGLKTRFMAPDLWLFMAMVRQRYMRMKCLPKNTSRTEILILELVRTENFICSFPGAGLGYLKGGWLRKMFGKSAANKL